MLIPFGRIPIGQSADHHEAVCLSEPELQGHTYMLGSTESGADRILAAVAVYQAAAGRPTVILDEADHIRDHLNTFPYPGIQALTYDSFTYAPAHNPLAPDAPETDTDIRDAIRYHNARWDDRLDQILPRTFRSMREHNRRHPDVRRLELDDLSIIKYPTSASVSAEPVLCFGPTAIAATDPEYWLASDAPGLCADAVRQIGQNIIDQKAQRRTFYHRVCDQLLNPQNPKKTLLVHTKDSYPWRHLIPPATSAAFAYDAVNAMRTIGSSTQTPLLVMNHPQQATPLDWEQITSPAEKNPMHTMLVTSQDPPEDADQPLPAIANADTVVICRTSVQKLSSILNNCRIADDPSRIIGDGDSANTGYLWSRSRNEGVFFVDAAAGAR